jgi:hypothetical protein
MATVTQIRGSTQIMANTVVPANVSTGIVIASGANAFTGNQSHGGFLINNLGNGVAATDACTWGQAQGLIQGVNNRLAAQWATTGAEAYTTITSGSVVVITGTTLDGGSPAVNDFILIKDAPAAAGAGSPGSTQPGNGYYQVTNATTNLTVTRVNLVTGVAPQGTFCFIEGGTANASSGWVVSSPAVDVAFTYGTTAMKWTQFSGAGEITATAPLQKVGNTLSIQTMATNTIIAGNAGTPTITTLSGDATLGATGVVTIAAAAVTYAKIQNVAANSVIGNNTTGSATPVAVPLSVAAGTPAASTIPLWDANKNLQANCLIPGYATQALSGTTLTMTISSAQVQIFTGTTQAQTVTLPATAVIGQQWTIWNQGTTAAVTCNGSTSGTPIVVAGGASAVLTALSATPTTAAGWSTQYFGEAITSAKILTVTNSLTLSGTDGTTMTFPTTSATIARTDAANTFTGVQTMTSPAITTPAFSGTSTGTYTLGGTVTVASPILSGTVTGTYTIGGTPTWPSNSIPLASLTNASYATAATASTLAERDANANLVANNFLATLFTQAASATTLTLSASSAQIQVITTNSTQTQLITLPAACAIGQSFTVVNQSTQTVTVQSSAPTTVTTLPGAGSAPYAAVVFTATSATPTAATSWIYAAFAVGAGSGTVTSVSVASANGFAGTVATATSTPAITVSTSITGVVVGNGTSIAAATGTNICAPSTSHGLSCSEIVTINSTTSLTLAHTPAAAPGGSTSSVMLFQNGLLLSYGASFDYTISGTAVTLNTASTSGDIFLATYWY